MYSEKKKKKALRFSTNFLHSLKEKFSYAVTKPNYLL